MAIRSLFILSSYYYLFILLSYYLSCRQVPRKPGQQGPGSEPREPEEEAEPKPRYYEIQHDQLGA